MQKRQGRLTDFSVDTILKKSERSLRETVIYNPYNWLSCTRYNPPRLPRSKKEGGSKKKINRSARVPFNNTEIAALEDQYKKTPYLTSREVSELAKVLRITESRVKVWFQNRRARDRREIDGKVYRASSYEQHKMKDGKTKEEVPIFSMENAVLTAYSQCQAIFGRMISNLN
ncbi:homeobox protein MSX-1-like [Artemia franciscana]|uniref:Homeobox domain-containing protein n=1 Tax=Artemia franciscana TaxID=6661 RepID=A0AA88LDT4_ARTSF|nr:hypothetical protein QYM36_007590 [Artemia franciscana]